MSRRLWCLLGALASTSAFADAYDFRIYQLGNPKEGGAGFTPSANANFRAFARRLGAAITSTNLAPPETLGHSAFAISAELSVVDLGTAIGATDMPTVRPINGAVLLPSIHIRKGLPWSFELGVRAAWWEKSRMGTGTLELKWALNEGFTYLPDIGVRGFVTKILNSRDFDVTAGGLDLGIGKQFAVAGMVTLTPYFGWNLTFVGASTGNVDFNPSRTLAEADAPNAQFSNYYVYDSVLAANNTNNRFYGGFRFIAGVVMLGFEFSYTVLGSFTDDTLGTTVNMPAVLAYNSTIGFDF
ncbi:MAG: hypothetical protein Q8N23_26295 [Archangium sp.]|nr:hypothetical protein [Archangium sp.]MDP3156214.1 hypothetical protein [Archangium sp.]MDP3571551.1 hypothetical protein [Archangium sp.]